jgi:hypothetical protein
VRTLLALILALPAFGAPTYVYHSRPGAAHKFLVDFYGQYTDAFRVTTPRPAYDQPDLIPQAIALVAKAFAPFDVDVTTEYAPNDFMQVLVGGSNPNGSASTGQADSGVYNSMIQPDGSHPNATGWVYPNQLIPGDPVRLAQAICHEAGHIPGNLHQSDWVNGVLVNEYRAGVLMGNPYGYPFEEPHLWSTGLNSQGRFQDDAAVIGGVLGYATPVGEPGLALLVCGLVVVGCGRRRNLRRANTFAVVPRRLAAVEAECATARLARLSFVGNHRKAAFVTRNSGHGRDCITFLSRRSSRQVGPRPACQGTSTASSIRTNSRPAIRTAASRSGALTYADSLNVSCQPEATLSPRILKRIEAV